MPERFFRYIAPARVGAYATMGWQVLGELERSPYDQAVGAGGGGFGRRSRLAGVVGHGGAAGEVAR